MQILFINNNGAGFANYIDVPHGMTAEELFEREMRHAKAADYLIRVDSRPAAREARLSVLQIAHFALFYRAKKSGFDTPKHGTLKRWLYIGVTLKWNVNTDRYMWTQTAGSCQPPKTVDLLKQLKRLFNQTRLKIYGLTFFGSRFAHRKTCVATVD